MDFRVDSTGNVERRFGNRWYGKDSHGIYRSKYLFPIDEEERARLDMFHKIFLMARGHVLYSSPLDTTKDLRILDLGAGTGHWSIDMAKAVPRASVLGVDLNMIQPQRIPPAMEPPMEIDIEGDWDLLGRDWDLIHARTLFGSIQCWDNLYKKTHEHLKPGTGYLEQVDIDWVPRYEDGHVPYKCALLDWTDKLLYAMDRHGRSMRVEPKRTREQLEAAGFTDIHETSVKVGFNPWSEDRQERLLALYLRSGFDRAIKALSYGPMSMYLSMSIREIDLLCEAVLDELYAVDKFHAPRYKAYCRIYIWTARRSS